MSNTNLQFVGDLQSALNSYSETGTVIYTSEANMYVIKSDSSKLKISDIMFVSILPTIGVANKLYILTTTFSLNFYDTIWHEIKSSASNILVSDVANNFASIPKNVENVLKELFQFASNGKISVANVIGIPSVSTETFSQLTTDIQNIKNSFVTNLGSKGVSSLSTDTLMSLVANILNIAGGIGSSFVKSTKLNLTAPTTHVETLTNATTLQKLATSVLKYITGATGVVEYLSDFNNGDAINFTYPTSVVFDGTMHLIETPLNVITWDTGILVTSELYTSDLIDLTKFNSIETITITNNTIPTIVINGTCSPTSVIANSDINLNGILNLAQIIWTTAISGNGILKLAISIDSATTWKTFDGSIWNTVDINNKTEFSSNGMTPSVVNSLTKAQLELLRGSSQVIRFAYYLEKINISDGVNNDSIALKVDMNGTDEIASQTDFSYSLGTDMRTITYTINTSGAYTFVYADSV